MHEAISRFFRGGLGPVPIANVLPRKIMDLGCGSGAWAIQAATEFPAAQVLAVDLSPIPDRTLPQNLCFQRADLAAELNFGTETFDVVHARFVMCHVPNAKDAIARAARLVRPGGLLIIEDADIKSWAENAGPTVQQIFLKTLELLSAHGADGELGRKLETIINSLGSFERVQVKKIVPPFSGIGYDDATNELGIAMRNATVRAMTGMRGVTDEMAKQCEEEFGQSGQIAMYFTWASRH
ncbi:S-adenosyl-L-methionine-dependent methyltransferase [Mycena latifolia]|nr:S-adenosyl-L-methionine-dependent methyltransferase [Mycena latifolia]